MTTNALGRGHEDQSVPEQRRRFSPQFRAEAVRMVLETGKPIAEVARDLGINDGPLGNWVNRSQLDAHCNGHRATFDHGIHFDAHPA